MGNHKPPHRYVKNHKNPLRSLLIIAACAIGLTAFGQTAIQTPSSVTAPADNAKAVPAAGKEAVVAYSPIMMGIADIEFVTNMSFPVGEFTIHQGWSKLDRAVVAERIAKVGLQLPAKDSIRMATEDEIKQFTANRTIEPKSAAEHLVFIALKNDQQKVAKNAVEDSKPAAGASGQASSGS
jgi:hypothetical protein